MITTSTTTQGTPMPTVESAMDQLLSITDPQEVEEMIYDFRDGAVFHDAEVAYLVSIVAGAYDLY